MPSVMLDSRVVAFGAVRVAGDVHNPPYYPPTYSSGSEEEQHAAVEQIFRMALGQVGEIQLSDYAVLDGYNADGDIVADYGIRTATGFRFFYRKLNWRQEHYDA